MNCSRQYIASLIALSRSCDRPAPIMFEVLHEKGREFPDMADVQPTQQQLGFCFKNAYRLAVAHGLQYVEGYAATKSLGIPLEHAWCIDDAGRVYDPTWKDGVDYYGVPLTIEAVEHIMHKTGCYGAFGNLYKLRDLEPDGVLQLLLEAVIDP